MSDREFQQVESSQTTPPPRRKSGGLMSVLGLLVPVVAGGLTVFGAYFLFLEDWLKPPAKKAAETKSESTEPEEQNEPIARVRPVPRSGPLVQPDQSKTPSQSHPAIVPKSPQVSASDREQKAVNALSLARKMLENKPSAAPSWFQKVVDQYPGTKAADEAESWLKQHSREP